MNSSRAQSDSDGYPKSRAFCAKASLISGGTMPVIRSVDLPNGDDVGLDADTPHVSDADWASAAVSSMLGRVCTMVLIDVELWLYGGEMPVRPL